MGSGIVKNLLNSGHSITVWNRTLEKCKDFVKGGRYLEAQLQGSKEQSSEGSLVSLVAGDKSLFDDCQSCFQAMGKNSFYLGEVGNASKMNLVLQLMSGVALAGLAEGMALADRAGLGWFG